MAAAGAGAPSSTRRSRSSQRSGAACAPQIVRMIRRCAPPCDCFSLPTTDATHSLVQRSRRQLSVATGCAVTGQAGRRLTDVRQSATVLCLGVTMETRSQARWMQALHFDCERLPVADCLYFSGAQAVRCQPGDRLCDAM